MTWETRTATRADFDQIRDLYGVVFGQARPDEHDRWKFHDNPAGDLLAVLAVDGSRVVGQYALWPVDLDLGGEIVRGAQSLDTMVHPEFRGQGMFTKLAVACYEVAADRGIEALYGFPNAASYPGFVNRLNWDHSGEIARFVRVFQPSEVRSMPRVAGSVADAAARLLPKGSITGSAVEPAVPSDAELKLLLDAPAERGVCRVRRTPEWLRWRLGNDSRRNYRWNTVRRDGECIGWSVWGIRDDGHGVLADLKGVDGPAVAVAVAAAVRDAADSGVPALHAVTPVIRIMLLPFAGAVS